MNNGLRRLFATACLAAAETALAEQAAAQGVVINEIFAAPSGAGGDANGDGMVNTTQDEFVELVNVSAVALDLTSWSLWDSFTSAPRFVFPAFVLPPGCAVVVFGGGTPTGSFGGTSVFAVGLSGLALNNLGDTVSLTDSPSTTSTTIATHTYVFTVQNVSFNRDAEPGGSVYVRHDAIQGAVGNYSPGTRVDGSAFAGCTSDIIFRDGFE